MYYESVLQSMLSGKVASPTRVAYLRCILALCHTQTKASSLLPSFSPLLTGCVEKAAGKSVQAAALEEGLMAVHVLLETCEQGVCVCVCVCVCVLQDCSTVVVLSVYQSTHYFHSLAR